MPIAFPFHVDPTGRTAFVEGDRHIREMIEQVLFTAPGERVNRPAFGSGLKQLVFAPASDEMATATQHLVRAALQRWLGEYILVEAVEVTSRDATLYVQVQYVVRRNEQREVVQFEREV